MARIWEKYGWAWYLALGLLWLIVGISQVFAPDGLMDNEAQLVTGMSFSDLEALSPETTQLYRFTYGGLGMLKINWSLLVIAITITGYRKGEKWAWYTLWLVPGILVGGALFNASWFGGLNEALNFAPILTLSLLGLLLPYRNFFPKSP